MPLPDEYDVVVRQRHGNPSFVFVLGRDRRPTVAIARCVMPHHAMLNRVRAEYLEMPGLRLTSEQTGRLCDVERALYQRVLDALVVETCLCVTPDGRYARVSDDGRGPRPAKAALRTSPHSLKAS